MAMPTRKRHCLASVSAATGLYVTQDGAVMVAYGGRKIPISCAQYRANGYKPSLEKLMEKPPRGIRPNLTESGRRRSDD